MNKMKGIGAVLPMFLLIAGFLFVAIRPFESVGGVTVMARDTVCLKGYEVNQYRSIISTCGAASGFTSNSIKIDNLEFLIDSRLEVQSVNGVDVLTQTINIPVEQPVYQPVENLTIANNTIGNITSAIDPIQQLIRIIYVPSTLTQPITQSGASGVTGLSSFMFGIIMIGAGAFFLIKK